MANSKKSSTSKTARVMNLLSKNRDESADAELTTAQDQEEIASAQVAVPAVGESAAPAAAAAPAPAQHPSTPPIISSMQADSAISDQVLSALESALDNELGAAAEAAQSAPAAEVDKSVETAQSVLEQAEQDIPASAEEAPAPTVEPVADIPAPAAAVAEAAMVESDSPRPPTRFPVEPGTIYVNVMEALVEDKATKYIDMFGLCKCPRCVADVKALTLNRIEPKYVVMKTGDVIPRITLYEGQFSAVVTAQLLTACKIVMEHPRHDR